MREVSTRAAAALGSFALGAAALGATVATSEPARAADSEFAAAAPLSWAPCQNAALVRAGADCSFLTVPMDWHAPAGPKIQLALSRVKATHDRQGVILSNPG